MWVWLVVLVILALVLRSQTHIEYHVIHLSSRKDRLANIKKQQRKLFRPIHIFNATGPSKHPYLRPGEYGCYQSHMKLYRKISKRKGYSVIFEDDVDIQPGFHRKVETIIRRLKGKFDVVNLGNLDGNHKEQVVDNVYTVDTSKYLTGMHAYLIDNERTWNITSQLTYETAIDLEIPKRIAEGKIKAYVVWPPISHQNSSLHSFRNEKMCPRW